MSCIPSDHVLIIFQTRPFSDWGKARQLMHCLFCAQITEIKFSIPPIGFSWVTQISLLQVIVTMMKANSFWSQIGAFANPTVLMSLFRQNGSLHTYEMLATTNPDTFWSFFCFVELWETTQYFLIESMMDGGQCIECIWGSSVCHGVGK